MKECARGKRDFTIIKVAAFKEDAASGVFVYSEFSNSSAVFSR